MELNSERRALWNRYESLFQAALAYEPHPITLDMIRSAYLAGQYEILPGAHSAVLFRIVSFGGARNLHVCWGGGYLSELVEVIAQRIEAIAIELGCRAIFLDGRSGWARALRHRGFRAISKQADWGPFAKVINLSTLQERAKPMTAINYTINADYIGLATDTLITHSGDWLPGWFAAKAAFIPHLDAIITSNAFLSLTRDCYNHALTATASDVSELAQTLPAVCRRSFQEGLAASQSLHLPDEDFSWAETCAVALLGWSPTQHRLVGLRFSFSNNFEPELLPDGVYTNPVVADAPDKITEPEVMKLGDLCVFNKNARCV